MNNHRVLVDAILLALKEGTKTKDEAVAACVGLLKDGMLAEDYLQLKTETLFREVIEYGRTHPGEDDTERWEGEGGSAKREE